VGQNVPSKGPFETFGSRVRGLLGLYATQACRVTLGGDLRVALILHFRSERESEMRCPELANDRVPARAHTKEGWMTRSRRATMGLLAVTTASLFLAGCASTKDLDALRARVDGLESQHTAIDGRLDGLDGSVSNVASRAAEAEAKADQAIARAEAAEREAATAAGRADDAARRADAMFKKSVSK
jgi:outer membrane murein-binding lipoprotein Lpp